MPEVRIVKSEPGLVGGLDGESGQAAERLLEEYLLGVETAHSPVSEPPLILRPLEFKVVSWGTPRESRQF